MIKYKDYQYSKYDLFLWHEPCAHVVMMVSENRVMSRKCPCGTIHRKEIKDFFRRNFKC